MRRALTVLHALGLMLVVFSITYLLPVVASLVYDDGTLFDFLLAMVWTAGVGLLLWLLTRRYKGELSIRHGYLLVVAMWTAMPAVATLPLLLVVDGSDDAAEAQLAARPAFDAGVGYRVAV